MVDGALCRPLLDALGGGHRQDLADVRVVEIGPGGGVLTRELLATGARVTAVELDLAWALRLTRHPALSLVVADAMALGWEGLEPDTLVTGNLPYNVSTALITTVVRRAAKVPRMGFMVQLEVAERLVARPRDPAYGAYSVRLAAQVETTLIATLRPGSFRPAPKVTSAFVLLRRKPLPPGLEAAELTTFDNLVHLAFGQRRKTLRNALAAGLGRERADAAVTALAVRGVPSAARAEELALDDFVALHRFLCDFPAKLLD